MKRVIASVLILAAILLLPGCSNRGTRPYRDLAVSDIVSAEVLLQPPDKTLKIEDIGVLVELLRDVAIYEIDNTYSEYAGQAVTFNLTMSDVTKTIITEYNPFIIIDGAGYRAESDPCTALSTYANGLLDSADTLVAVSYTHLISACQTGRR